MNHTRSSLKVFARGSIGCALVFLAASCVPSQQDVQTAQALEDLGAAFSDLRLVQQEQQDRIDSLMQTLARQDSTLRTLANLAGVAVR
jgi:hypothetical protein